MSERDWLPIEDPLGQKPTRQQQISKTETFERYNEILFSEDCIQASEEPFHLVTQHILKFHDQKQGLNLDTKIVCKTGMKPTLLKKPHV